MGHLWVNGLIYSSNVANIFGVADFAFTAIKGVFLQKGD